jgi:putative glutamine amidotransferase
VTTPRIGLTTYLTPGQMTIYSTELAVLPAQYIGAVSRAGGVAVMIPPQPLSHDDALRILAGIDGLIITGGADINPARYGQPRGPHTQEPEDLRDAAEDTLLRAAREISLPLLGICRGAQMLNVHLGGTLHQHLPDVVGHDRYRVGDGVFHAEPMTIMEGTLLHRILGETEVAGPVYHHQAIDQVAPGLVVSARGFDGTIQAIEMSDYPFGLAVQWHPEENLDDVRIIQGLISSITA